MIFRSHRITVIAAALLAITLASPTFAGQKRRAVKPPAAGAVAEKTNGLVTDASNARPVVFATVTAGEIATTTDAEGKWQLDVPVGTNITFSRSGYQTVTKPVPTNKILNVTMTGLPTVRVRMTSDVTYDLDLDSTQFSYLVPFSGYVKSDSGKFCKPDGSEFKPEKTTIKRFIGPATASTSDACCKDKTPLKARLEMKSGDQTDVFFTDTCFGYEVDLVGRNHLAGDFVYLKFNDIAEIVFP